MSKRWLTVVVVVGLLALYASFVNNKMKFGGDAIDYYRLGESISAGHGYTIDGNFVSKWPPVTPLLVALGIGVFHADIAGIKMLLGSVALGGLIMAFFLLRAREEATLGAWAVGITAVSLPFIYWILDLSSEGPYFFWTMAALWLGQRALDEQKKPHCAFLAGICIGLSYLTRTAGATLLVGFVLYALIAYIRQRNMVLKPVLLIIIPALLMAGGWTLYSKQQGGESSIKVYSKYGFRPDIYDPSGTNSLANSLERAKKNLQGYAFIFSIPDSSLRADKMARLNVRGLASLGIMLLAAVGFVGNLVKRPQFAECYLLAYGGVLLVVSWYDIRYVVPVMPLLFYYVGWTIRRMTKPVIVIGIMALLVLGNLGISIASQPAKRLRSPEYRGFAKNYYDASMWIKNNDPNAVVMCGAASMTWFWTRMKVKAIPLIQDPEAMWKHLRTANVSMVIDFPNTFSGVNEKYLKPVLLAHQTETVKVMQFGEVVIYRIPQVIN